MAPNSNPRSDRQQAHGIVRAPVSPVPAAQPDIVRPTDDHAYRILNGIPDDVMSTDSKADAWDAFYQSHHSQELAQKLANIDAPEQVKTDLWNAKRNFSDPVPTALDRATAAVHRVAALDPQVLETMERSPHILNALMTHLRQSREE